MKAIPCSVIGALVCGMALSAQAATGPVVSGLDNVFSDLTLNLDPGTATAGSWIIDWGDGTISNPIPVSQTETTHTYENTGSFEVTAVLKNGSGTMIDSQYSYRDLVNKSAPLVHYNFEDAGGSQHIGPAVTKQGSVSTVASFAGSTGNAVRLASGGYLSVPDLKLQDADFFGFEFWLKPANLITRQMIYAGLGEADGNVRLYIENNHLCFDLVGSGVVKSVPLGHGVEPGRWYHFGVSYERSPYFKERNVLRFYQDGFLLKEDAYTAAQSRAVNHAGATIGVLNTGTDAAPFTTYPFSGDIDEIVLHPLGVFPGPLLRRYRAATSNRSAFRVSTSSDGAAPFTVNPPMITQEITVGLDSNPSTDNAPRIRTAIGGAGPGTRIKLVDQTTGQGGGTYYLKTAVSGPHVGRVIMLNGKTDVELDGNGVNFLVTNHRTRFLEVNGSTRVAVKNISFDIDPASGRSSTYAQVLNVDPAAGKLTVRWVKGASLAPDFVPANLNLWRWRRVDASTRNLRSGVREWFLSAKTPDSTDGSVWTLTFKPDKHPVDNWVWAEFGNMQAAGDLLQVNNAHFVGNAVSTENSKHLTFDGYKLYGFAGMGMLFGGRTDNVKVINSKIGLPPGQTALDRPFSTASDGVHFHDSQSGGFLFENNDIGMTDDDPVSIKDPVIVGAAKVADNQLQHSNLWTGLMELLKPDLTRFDPPFIATVTGFSSSTGIATFDRSLPGNLGDKFHVQKRYLYSGNYILRGNNIHDLNGRMMLYTGDGTVINNRFRNLYFHIGFSADYYEGSGEPYNIVVANNLFLGNNTADASVWGPKPSAPVINDLGVSNNSFLNVSWATNYTARPNFTNNYSEKVSTGAGKGIYQFKARTTAATAFGNVHYDPAAPLIATGDASSDFTQGDNELIPGRAAAADVIVDNTGATFTGTWGTSSFNTGQFFGANYRWSNTAGATAQFTPNLPAAGTYRVYAMWNGGADRGRTVPYTIIHAGGTSTVTASQRTASGLWVYLGTYTFNAGTGGSVKVANTGANGLIIADGVRFQQ